MSEDAGREEQLAYSEIMAKMLDEEARRKKAAKIVAVVRHALGVETLDGLRAVDVGCSAGFIADELALAGAATSGVDIDEPGLEKARARFGERVDFRLARGEDLPFEDASVDVAVLNHIYEHVVDPEAVGLPLTAFISVKPFDPSAPDDIADRLAGVPEIEACHSVAGDENYILKVRVATPHELEELLARVRSLAGVSTRTTVVLSTPYEARPPRI